MGAITFSKNASTKQNKSGHLQIFFQPYVWVFTQVRRCRCLLVKWQVLAAFSCISGLFALHFCDARNRAAHVIMSARCVHSWASPAQQSGEDGMLARVVT